MVMKDIYSWFMRTCGWVEQKGHDFITIWNQTQNIQIPISSQDLLKAVYAQ